MTYVSVHLSSISHISCPAGRIGEQLTAKYRVYRQGEKRIFIIEKIPSSFPIPAFVDLFTKVEKVELKLFLLSVG